MEDTNLIACLYPADENLLADHAIRLHEKNAQYIPPLDDALPTPSSRESTVSVEDEDEDDDKIPMTAQPGLQLTFNPGPKAGQGFMFGTDKNRCDIILPKRSSNRVGRHHCVLTFDAERRLILRDLSKNGTIVTYDGQGEEKRSTIIRRDDKGQEKRHHFIWVLNGSEATVAKRIVIQIDDIKFQIIVSKHEMYPDLYNKNIDRFLREVITNDELALGALGIQSSSTTSTAQQSGLHTPTPHMPMYINQGKIGSGAFSIVNRVWDVSTGFVYASKEFRHKESNWKREALVMDQVLQLSNEHIIQLVSLVQTPSPRLILEYLPFGNLQYQHTRDPITDEESLIILCQSLDALSAIHENNLVHRDIKPENILVYSRQPLHIKLSDFGLSRTASDLETFCGTAFFVAPEIYTLRRGRKYTKACDIWSLGVVVLGYVSPLSEFCKNEEGPTWCKRIIHLVNTWNSNLLLDFLSTAMLLMDPQKRLSARECWEQALQLSSLVQSSCRTPTQAFHSLSELATPSATPTGGMTTFDLIEAFQNYERHRTNSAQATDHYLVGDSIEKQEPQDQRDLVDSPNKDGTSIWKERKTKRTTDSGPFNTPTQSAQLSKRLRQIEHRLDLLLPESVDGADIFGSNWLQDPNCIAPRILHVGEEQQGGTRHDLAFLRSVEVDGKDILGFIGDESAEPHPATSTKPAENADTISLSPEVQNILLRLD